MYQASARRPRRGATLVESSFVIVVFLTFVLVTLDLGIRLFHYHLIAEAARQGARQAIVHGSRATPLGGWGFTQVGPISAADSHPLAQAIRAHLAGLAPAEVTITAEWLDGSNERESRVRVTVTTAHQSFLTALFGNGSITLRASSQMSIIH